MLWQNFGGSFKQELEPHLDLTLGGRYWEYKKKIDNVDALGENRFSSSIKGANLSLRH